MRLVDASFIWTEPHSRRVKVKLTIQKEVYTSTVLQQVFSVEYIVANQYCDACTRIDAKLTWKAVCQVRQKISHKKTFLWLEQVILKHNAHKDTSNIQEFRDGLDFFYGHRNNCLRMVDFLSSIVPTRYDNSFSFSFYQLLLAVFPFIILTSTIILTITCCTILLAVFPSFIILTLTSPILTAPIFTDVRIITTFFIFLE